MKFPFSPAGAYTIEVFLEMCPNQLHFLCAFSWEVFFSVIAVQCFFVVVVVFNLPFLLYQRPYLYKRLFDYE